MLVLDEKNDSFKIVLVNLLSFFDPTLFLKMPSSSFIPYTTYSIPEALGAYHSAMCPAAYKRLRSVIVERFYRTQKDNLHFLLCMMHGVLHNKHAAKAYAIVFESFGVPLFVLRNLSHTLQDLEDRMVYVIHLEDALTVWNTRHAEETMWETIALVSAIGIIAAGIAWGIVNMIPSSPVANIRPHSLFHFFHAS